MDARPVTSRPPPQPSVEPRQASRGRFDALVARAGRPTPTATPGRAAPTPGRARATGRGAEVADPAARVAAEERRGGPAPVDAPVELARALATPAVEPVRPLAAPVTEVRLATDAIALRDRSALELRFGADAVRLELAPSGVELRVDAGPRAAQGVLDPAALADVVRARGVPVAEARRGGERRDRRRG